MKNRIAWTLLALLLMPGAAAADAPAPRNVIVMIGDGMGLAQITAGLTAKGSLSLEAFKTIGLVRTQAYGSQYITDSAASATAMATGVLTYNGAIGVGPDTTSVKTVMELAREQGRKTGIVVVCSITHATPACYVAHVPSRRMELDIAAQIAYSDTDLLLGSGWSWFLPKDRGGKRQDGRDLIEDMKARGYRYVSNPREFEALDLESTPRLLGLFAAEHMDWAQHRQPALARMTYAALEFLSNEDKGFFLVVEGSQIDWAGHDNDADQVAVEMEDFDDAIAEVLRFVKDRDDTLVIVTADHETGGYALVDGSVSEKRVEGRFSTTHHTGTMIPLFAMGPGSEGFAGIYSSAHIGRTLFDLLDAGSD
jgi:alkaline phosphatase